MIKKSLTNLAIAAKAAVPAVASVAAIARLVKDFLIILFSRYG